MKWINIKDERPKLNQKVLVYGTYPDNIGPKGKAILLARYLKGTLKTTDKNLITTHKEIKNTFFLLYVYVFEDPEITDVIHWMPLPEIPN